MKRTSPFRLFPRRIFPRDFLNGQMLSSPMPGLLTEATRATGAAKTLKC